LAEKALKKGPPAIKKSSFKLVQAPTASRKVMLKIRKVTEREEQQSNAALDETPMRWSWELDSRQRFMEEKTNDLNWIWSVVLSYEECLKSNPPTPTNPADPIHQEKNMEPQKRALVENPNSTKKLQELPLKLAFPWIKLHSENHKRERCKQGKRRRNKIQEERGAELKRNN
jgi:hypothetical protein